MSPHSGSFVQTPGAMPAANGVLKTVSDFKIIRNTDTAHER
jgi:hypothetical protein